MINSLSEDQYKEHNGRLIKTNGRNTVGSSRYSKAINNLIKRGNTVINIGESFKNANGVETSLPVDIFWQPMAGYTYGYANGESSIMRVTITGKESLIYPYNSNYSSSASVAEILMHEIAGHAEPATYSVEGNAIAIENEIKAEIATKKYGINYQSYCKLRMPDDFHISWGTGI